MTLDGKLADVHGRLERLFDVLETGRLKLDDLAPRIQELMERQDLLIRAKAEAEETVSMGSVEIVDRTVILSYLQNLGDVLELVSVTDWQAFLRSFIKAIVKHDSSVVIEYALPLPKTQMAINPPVLDIDSYGGPNRTISRTSTLTFVIPRRPTYLGNESSRIVE